jgi:hypothetical protein
MHKSSKLIWDSHTLTQNWTCMYTRYPHTHVHPHAVNWSGRDKVSSFTLITFQVLLRLLINFCLYIMCLFCSLSKIKLNVCWGSPTWNILGTTLGGLLSRIWCYLYLMSTIWFTLRCSVQGSPFPETPNELNRGLSLILEQSTHPQS